MCRSDFLKSSRLVKLPTPEVVFKIIPNFKFNVQKCFLKLFHILSSIWWLFNRRWTFSFNCACKQTRSQIELFKVLEAFVWIINKLFSVCTSTTIFLMRKITEIISYTFKRSLTQCLSFEKDIKWNRKMWYWSILYFIEFINLIS